MVSFDDVFNKARDVANLAGKKASELAEISKLKLKAVQLNSDIQRAYERLGAIVYEQEKNTSDNTDLIAISVSEIDLLFTELNELNDRISESKSIVKCHNCGVSNPEDALYCTRCGTALSRTKSENTVYTQSETVDAEVVEIEVIVEEKN